MSIWTSRYKARPLFLGIMMCTFLAGCLEGLPAGQSAPSSAKSEAAKGSFALASATIVPDKVVVAGPRGFCIDKRSLKTGRSGGFALLVPCAALDAEAQGLGLETAILTLQAQPQRLQSAQTSANGLAEAFKGEVPIYTENGDGMSIVQLAQGGDTLIPNGDGKHWRAALRFNGYLIGLAVYSEKDGVAAGSSGKALLIEFAEAVLAASPLQQVTSEAE